MFIDLYSIPVFAEPLSTHDEVKEDFKRKFIKKDKK